MKNPWRWKFALFSLIVVTVTMTLVTVAWLTHHTYVWSGPITLITGSATIYCQVKQVAGAIAWERSHRIIIKN